MPTPNLLSRFDSIHMKRCIEASKIKATVIFEEHFGNPDEKEYPTSTTTSTKSPVSTLEALDICATSYVFVY